VTFRRAELEAIVPRKMNKYEAQAWAKEILCGGPPDQPIDVKTGEVIGWAHLKVGQKIRLRANPMGLIKEYPDGMKKYIAGAITSCNTTVQKSTFSVAEMQRRSQIEMKKREFAQHMIAKYNRNRMDEIRKSGKEISRAFWLAGREIRQFLDQNEEIKFSHIMLELKQWGIGCSGYAEQWFDLATKFYDWKPDLSADNPIFFLSETRIMNLVRVRNITKQDNLLISIYSGALHNITEKKYDELFKWIIGQSPNSCKEKALYRELNEIGKHIMAGIESPKDEEQLLRILKNLNY
jgi:hypothetical protein